jgi:hypothetical protein
VSMRLAPDKKECYYNRVNWIVQVVVQVTGTGLSAFEIKQDPSKDFEEATTLLCSTHMIPLRSVKSDFFDITIFPKVGAITSDCFEIFIW